MKAVPFRPLAAVNRLIQRAHVAQLSVAVAVMSSPFAALAQVPDIPLPAGTDANNLPGILRWGIGVVILLLALFIAGFGILSVGASALQKFREYTNGRADVGDVITTTGLGIGILVVALLMVAGALRVIPVTIV